MFGKLGAPEQFHSFSPAVPVFLRAGREQGSAGSPALLQPDLHPGGRGPRGSTAAEGAPPAPQPHQQPTPSGLRRPHQPHCKRRVIMGSMIEQGFFLEGLMFCFLSKNIYFCLISSLLSTIYLVITNH